jgi:signal transduction histidine kinase
MNALQATPKGDMLTLRTYMENRELKIAVQDTDCGILPKT